MQCPKPNNAIFENRSVTMNADYESIFKIGPWPVKRSKSEGEAFKQAGQLDASGLSFSETMAQVDEVYAIAREMEGLEKTATHSLYYKKRICDFLLAFLIMVAIIIAAIPPLVVCQIIDYHYNGNLPSQPRFTAVGWSRLSRVFLYIAAGAVGAVLWITLILILHIRNPFIVQLSARSLALSSCAGNLLAIWTLKWI